MLEPVFTPEQIAMLNTPLQQSEIEQKQGMSYLKGQLAVVKANNIFGLGNWGYEQIGPIEMIETVTSNSNDRKVILATAMVKVTVKGCIVFVEQGDCEAQGAGYAALSMARKGAVTDGLKRCLKNFGPTFGLDLYFKTPPVQAASQPTTQNRSAPATRPQVTQNSQQQPNRPAPAPQAVKTAPVTPATPKAAPTADGNDASQPMSEQQRTAILRIAGNKGMEEIELSKRLNELYGIGLDLLNKSTAGHFIKVLQGQA